MERDRRTRQSNKEYRERIRREMSQGQKAEDYSHIRVVPRSDERIKGGKQSSYTVQTVRTSVNMYGAGQQVREPSSKRAVSSAKKAKRQTAASGGQNPARQGERRTSQGRSTEQERRRSAGQERQRSASQVRTAQRRDAGTDRKAAKRVYFDYTLVFIVVFLVMFGLLMLYTASIYTDSYFFKQCMMSVIGVVFMIGLSFVDYHFYAKKPVILLIGAGSVIAVLLVRSPLGVSLNGASRWIGIGSITVQPAEIFKIGVILVNAVLIVKWSRNIAKLRVLLVFLIMTIAEVLLILLVTDNLSSALIIGLITVFMVFVAHPGYKLFFGAAGAFGALACGFVYYVLHSGGSDGNFRFGRIIAWLAPERLADQSKVYQTNQALYAIGSGGLWGKGLGSGTQKMILPEAMNDMIFAIICEELGMIGAFLVLVMFAILLYRLMFIAKNSKDLLGGMIVTGIFSHFMLQVVLNLGVVTNLLPSTGVTLPFISYGGTATILLMAEVGIALNVSKQIDFEQPKLVRRKKSSASHASSAK